MAGAVLPAVILSSVGLSTSVDTEAERGGFPEQASHQPRAVDPGPCNRHWTEPQMEFVKDKREWGEKDHMGTLHWAFMLGGCRTWWYGRAGSGNTWQRNGCIKNGPIPDSGYGRHKFTFRYNRGSMRATTGWLWQVENIDCRHINPGVWRTEIFVHSSGLANDSWGDKKYGRFISQGCVKVQPKTLRTLRSWQWRDRHENGRHRVHGTIKVRQL